LYHARDATKTCALCFSAGLYASPSFPRGEIPSLRKFSQDFVAPVNGRTSIRNARSRKGTAYVLKEKTGWVVDEPVETHCYE